MAIKINKKADVDNIGFLKTIRKLLISLNSL